MACLDHGSSELFHNTSSDLQIEDQLSDDVIASSANNDSISSQPQTKNVPKAPPMPMLSFRRINAKKTWFDNSFVPYEIRQAWNRLFDEGYGADLHILTDDKGLISAHSSVLGNASPVLRNLLDQTPMQGGIRRIKIHGVPMEAASVFVRFLYSFCYHSDDMKQHVIHLLVMSHVYSVPSLKNICIRQLEQEFLTSENVVDVLQLARECDAPRLSVICTRMIIKDFKNISLSEGWKVMRKAKPNLEQELLELLVEVDSRRQERLKQIEEKKVYMQLHEAMEALVHICRDGCKTIGPRDQTLVQNQGACNFSACKGLESLVRHFSICMARTSGICAHCKRMWQLLELHSRMCSQTGSCKVPLCRHFKDKIKKQSKNEEQKWKLLVRKVMAVEGTISSISAWRFIHV